MSIIQHSWQKSQNVIPGNQEVVWVVNDQGKVNLVVHQERNGESYLSWRFFGTRDFLYGHRWWQKTSSNLDPRPEPPRPEAAQEGVYGPGDPPDMAPSLLPQNPDRVNAPEPLGEPANVRTELMILTEMVRVLLEARNAFDIYRREVDARLDEIEKHTDFSHNSK